MTEREIKAAIYLTGIGRDPRVVHNVRDETCEIPELSTKIGNAIVRALRNLQRNAAGRGSKME